MNVLSLFDGMSCTQIALNRVGIKYDNYFASEIDKPAMKVTMANYPNTIQLGDVKNVFAKDLPPIGLIVGGSPCQGFSFAGKMLAFDDPRSALFFEFVRILNEARAINPDVKFLLENVRMKKEHELIISRYLGVAPIEIDSALVSGQSRKRNYWTNISSEPYGLFGDMQCTIPQPKDKGILLKDILETDVPEKYYLSDKMLEYFKNRPANFNGGKVNIRDKDGKASTLTKSMSAVDISDNFVIDSLPSIIQRSIENEKATTLDANYYKMGGVRYGVSRQLVEQTNTITQKPRGYNKGGNFTEKSPSLTSHSWEHNNYVGNIRRLTPTECERVQTVDDGFTAHVSDTQRYKMLGNGMTVDVIGHILKHLK